ncbi:hypothetical protein K3495_g3385 [Podosphaera aphanis]|nr:hypothetical protein K3495_g3385 [Podosphaera aphanis]
MGIQAPFLYDAPKREGSRSPVYHFDPRAVSRACNSAKAPRPKVEGPLISFNANSNSYLFTSKDKSHHEALSPSVKKYVARAKVSLIALRYMQLLCTCILVATGIVAQLTPIMTAWMMRLTPAVAVIHTAYGLYHLSYKAAERVPTSAASYALFASILDSVTVPLLAFVATIYAAQPSDPKPPAPGDPSFNMWLCFKMGFYFSTMGSGLYILSLGVSFYLATVFRKIAAMPPDMNPLEDNLTSRHKRNKSSMATSSSVFEDLKSSTFESKRSSTVCEESHSKSENSSPSRLSTSPSHDSRLDLPSMKYAIPSRVELKRSSGYTFSPSLRKHVLPQSFKKHNLRPSLKKPSYVEISISDDDESLYRDTRAELQPTPWYADDSLRKKQPRAHSASPKKNSAQYTLFHPQTPTHHDVPSPLKANPLAFSVPKESLRDATPRTPPHMDSASPNTRYQGRPRARHPCAAGGDSGDSGDIGDASLDIAMRELGARSLNGSPRYGELTPGKPPVMVGRNGARQVSSGHDYAYGECNMRGLERREVSGKVAEEGRSGEPRPLRFRKFSGKLLF